MCTGTMPAADRQHPGVMFHVLLMAGAHDREVLVTLRDRGRSKVRGRVVGHRLDGRSPARLGKDASNVIVRIGEQEVAVDRMHAVAVVRSGEASE